VLKTVSKFWTVNLLLAVAVLVSSFSPCSCFAEQASDNHSQKNSQACHEQESNTEQADNRCDNCSECFTSSTCHAEIGENKATQKLAQFHGEHSGEVLISLWLPRIVEQINTTPSNTGPPGFCITSSATLSTFLHRWLI